MKRILSLIAITLSFGMFAQTGFTGTIDYAITVTGENADQMAAFMPTSYKFTFGTDKVRFEMVGGMMAEMMGYFIAKDDELYMVKDAEQIAYNFSNDDESDEDNGDILKTNETKVILGHTCTKYTVTTTKEGESASVIMWVASDLRPPVTKMNAGASSGIMNSKIDGLALMVETVTMGMSMTMKASNINNTAPAETVFEIPSNYSIEEFDPAMFGGGM